MILLIDNYDSFVFNIKTMLEKLTSEEIRVVRNDAISLEQIKALKPNAIIISPGPKHPKDSAISLELFKARLQIPMLGVCLGHQALALAFGSEIARLDAPAHGSTSLFQICKENPLFKDMPQSFEIMRYHSLYASNLGQELEPLGYSDDNILMALAHKNLPYFGVQFHPESYFSEYGLKIFSNFLAYARAKKEPQKSLQEEQKLSDFITKLQDNMPLVGEDFEKICKIIASKDYEEVQLGALLVLITEKSLNEQSLSALVQNILKYSQTFSDESDMIDIVGTGGDGFKSINVSTTCAFILAALGVKVAKHGNKAISSASGSSDVLEELGIKSFSSLEKQRKILDNEGLAFFHAPHFHSLVSQIKDVRVKLGVRTVFNVLGPLMNPNLKLKYQMMGNYHAPVHSLLIKVLKNLGRKGAILVRGNDGMDELSISDESLIYELREGEITHYSITPEQFGFERAFHSEIRGGSAKENAQILLDTLSGKQKGAKFDIVLLNASFALYTANFAKSPLEAKQMILEAIHSGKVISFFNAYKERLKAYDEA